MVDRYTKTVLTIIAAALVGLLAVQLTPAARAQMTSGGASCGWTPANACFVKASPPLEVTKAP